MGPSEETTAASSLPWTARSLLDVFEYEVLPACSQRAHSHGGLFGNHTAKLILGCWILALGLRRTEPLYGILAALSLEIVWLVLKWSLYFFEDPELAQSYRFIRGWAVFACNQGVDMIEGGKMRELGTVLMGAKRGMKIGTGVLRQMNHNMNAKMLQNMDHHLSLRQRMDRLSLRH